MFACVCSLIQETNEPIDSEDLNDTLHKDSNFTQDADYDYSDHFVAPDHDSDPEKEDSEPEYSGEDSEED